MICLLLCHSTCGSVQLMHASLSLNHTGDETSEATHAHAHVPITYYSPNPTSEASLPSLLTWLLLYWTQTIVIFLTVPLVYLTDWLINWSIDWFTRDWTLLPFWALHSHFFTSTWWRWSNWPLKVFFLSLPIPPYFCFNELLCLHYSLCGHTLKSFGSTQPTRLWGDWSARDLYFGCHTSKQNMKKAGINW